MSARPFLPESLMRRKDAKKRKDKIVFLRASSRLCGAFKVDHI